MCYSIAPLLVDFTSLRHFIADFIPVLTSVLQIEETSEKFRRLPFKKRRNLFWFFLKFFNILEFHLERSEICFDFLNFFWKFQEFHLKIGESLWGMHTRICLRSTICICYCCHIYFVSFIKIYRLLLRPFVFWANICSVIPRHFLSASNQKSCERPSLEENF